MLAASYDFLRTTPPFRAWRLPPSDEIELNVISLRDREGEYTRYCGTSEHIIGISGTRIGHTDSLIAVMAHEMIHLKQAISKTETKGTMHNAEFRQLAQAACRAHGWDPKLFV